MKMFKLIISVPVIMLMTSSLAFARSECHLRNLTFVSTLWNGELIINAELYEITADRQFYFVEQKNNATYCSVGEVYGGIPAKVCQTWYTTAMTALLTGKSIYLTADSCLPDNGGNLQEIAIFGINP